MQSNVIKIKHNITNITHTDSNVTIKDKCLTADAEFKNKDSFNTRDDTSAIITAFKSVRKEKISH